MTRLASFITRRPRTAASVAFGVASAVLTHVAWAPAVRLSGAIPVLTVGAGAAHALAGAMLGRRLVDRARMKNAYQAALLGGGVSVLALIFFAPPFAMWVSASNARPEGVWSFVATTVLVALFSFLAAGWALVLVSAGVGWALFRATTETNRAQSLPGSRSGSG